MTETARTRQRANDALSLDRFPSCPHCGNLCGKLARVCYDCGAHLFQDVTNDGRRRLTAEDATPTKGLER